MNIESMVVKDIMNPNPIYVHVDDPLSKVISILKENRIHEVPVVDDKKRVRGYFDYENLMRRKNVPLTAKISTLMIFPPKVEEELPVVEAIRVMVNNGLRSLPVTKANDLLTGLVSRTDFTRALLNSPEYINTPISDVMVKDPITVNEDDDVYVALDKMRGLNEMTIPVVDSHGHLKGMLHIDDLSGTIWRIKERPTFGEYKGQKEKKIFKVKEFLSPPVFVKSNAKLKDAIKQMLDMKSYVCVIVDDDMKPVGIITQKDIIENFVKRKEEESVFVQITGLETEDPSVFDTIYDIVEKYLKKINKFENYRPQSLTFHVEEHRPNSNEIEYTLRARLVTEKKVFYKTDHDWNLFSLFDRVMSSLYRTVRKDKEKEKELRKIMP
ncbi:MAG: CBS domain-containing protein [Thermoplasmata archaeon]|jgi:CBS domain-containing protein/ribosome-associated translation inhibitor RaiA|nr:CBS domain-containing protein [Thermoplasmatales archaeon]